jgi:NAD(P)-dependent dehydrogenase (short-subunit alcohol dehydrogenase family)
MGGYQVTPRTAWALISNAGVEYFGPLAGITEEDFRRVFDTNAALASPLGWLRSHAVTWAPGAPWVQR